MNDLERELEETLHRVLDPIAARPIPPRRGAMPRRGAFRTVAGGAGAALTVKVLTGVVALAAAVTVAGAVTTGSINPVVWGQQVSEQVETCKANIANSGQHGIGECVSDFANTHGSLVSSDARHHGGANDKNGGNGTNGSGSSNGHNNTNGNGKGKGRTTPPPHP